MCFERIYDEHFHDVARWVRALGARQSDINDVVQDVFIIAFRRLAQFDGRNASGWLYQIARRKMRDYRRLSWVKHFFSAQTSNPEEDALIDELTPLGQLETREKAASLERMLDTLPLDQRAAFVLFEIEGTSGLEIARLQDVALTTVWARIYRARQKLQHQLVADRDRQPLPPR